MKVTIEQFSTDSMNRQKPLEDSMFMISPGKNTSAVQSENLTAKMI